MVSYEQEHRMCHTCDGRSLHYRRAVDHVLHLLLAVVTGGIWVLGWFYLGLNRDKWRCRECGRQSHSRY